jgi:drug/metabolite transporter (DMT)-like permease
MVSVVAALASALSVGASDFLGAVAARRQPPLVVTTWVNVFSLASVAIACIAIHPHVSQMQALGAAIGGACSILSLTLIYAAMTAGAISLAAPLIACGSAIVPTLAAVAAGSTLHLGQLLGIALALLGIVLITHQGSGVPLNWRPMALAAAAAVASGCTVSVLQVAAGDDAASAIGALGVARIVGVSAALAGVAFLSQHRLQPLTQITKPIIGAGALDAAGSLLFLFGTAIGNRAVVAVIVSLYAVVTVLFAQLVLRERILRHQGLGIAASAGGVALLALT